MLWVLGLWIVSLDAGGSERASSVCFSRGKVFVGGSADGQGFMAALDTSGALLGSWLVSPFEEVLSVGPLGEGLYLAGLLIGGRMGLLVLDSSLSPLWGVEFWVDSEAVLSDLTATPWGFAAVGVTKSGSGFLVLLDSAGSSVIAKITPRAVGARFGSVIYFGGALYVAGALGGPALLAFDPLDASYIRGFVADTSGEFLAAAGFDDGVMALGWALRCDTVPVELEIDTLGAVRTSGALVAPGAGAALASSPTSGPVGFGSLEGSLWAFRWGHSPDAWLGLGGGEVRGAAWGAGKAWACGQLDGDALLLNAYYTGNFCGSAAAGYSRVGTEAAPAFVSLQEIGAYSNSLDFSLLPVNFSAEILCEGPEVRESPEAESWLPVRVYDAAGRLVSANPEGAISLKHLPKGVYFLELKGSSGVKVKKLLRR